MPVEVAKLVDDFNKLWPRGTDSVSKADNHIRMIKEVLQLEFELLYNKTRVFSFEAGAVVNPDCILYYEAEKVFYQWNGTYDVNNKYIVPAGSTPVTAGGIGGNAWTRSTGSGFMSTVLVSDTEPTAPFQNMLWWDTNSGTFFIYYNDGTSTQWVDLFGIADQASFNTLLFRSILARLAAESGYTLVDGSFQEGAISSGFSDVVLDWNTAKFYQWHLDENKEVPAGSTPETTGGIDAGAWVDRTDVVLRDQLAASTGATKVGTSDGRTVEQRLAALPNEVETALAASAYIKDAIRHAVEGATGGKVTIMYDAQGNPNYMVRVPKFNLQDIDSTLGTGVHPAFIVNGVEKSEIWIGQHVGSLVNGVLCSLPGQDPANNMSFDEAVTYCRNKGAGWHLMTNAEWAAIKLWCLKNGFLPRGNSNYGRSSEAAYETGTRYDGIAPGTLSGTARTLTGSGPASWRHNNDFAGIADLAGNVWEWASGLRLNNGEIQVLANNDAALATADLSSASSDWRAISMTDGSLVLPSSAGTAKFDSDAAATSGTGSRGAFTLSNVIANRLGPVDDSTNNYQLNMQTFEVSASKVKSGLTAPAILKVLGVYPHATGYGSDYIYMRNYGERLPIAGGNWAIGISGGVFALNLSGPRSGSNSDLGARPAFIA